MKKTLLSVLAGLAVINAASAVPSVEDRKAMCSKHPEKYVWVEKNEACIPIDPCLSSNPDIEHTYCISNNFDFPRDKTIRTLVVDRLAKNVWNTEVVSIITFPDYDDGFGVFTSDGGYFAGFLSPFERFNKIEAAQSAFFAYGYNWGFNGDETEIFARNVDTYRICQDIVDFAGLLFEAPLDFKYANESCVIYLK